MFTELKSDFSRYTRSRNPFIVFAVLIHNPGMIFSLLHRTERYLLYESNILLRIVGYILYPLYFICTYYILTYHIEPSVKIGAGLFLHNHAIVITDNTVIGKNVSIMGQTTIGTDFVQTGNVYVSIGNGVKIGTGARIIAKEKLNIADNVTIGANAVVTKSIMEKGSVYAGIPAKRIRSRNL